MKINVKRYLGSCNSYIIGNILIDAAHGIELPVADIVIITHEHCDHFAGLKKHYNNICASKFCADVINNSQEQFGLCRSLGITFPEARITKTLKDGDKIHGNGFELNVVETPGHAKGAICLYEEQTKTLFSGDTVFPNLGFPNCALPTSEPEKLIESYERLNSLDIDNIYPGHGEEIKEREYMKKILKEVKQP